MLLAMHSSPLFSGKVYILYTYSKKQYFLKGTPKEISSTKCFSFYKHFYGDIV